MADSHDKIIVDDSMDLSDDALYELALVMDPHDEQQCLSQKLSQLSASEDQHSSEQSTRDSTKKRSPRVDISAIPKRRKTIDDQDVADVQVKDSVPNCLSIHQQNNFQQLFQSMLSQTASSMHMEDLQEMALLMHQMTMLDLQKDLWHTYLQSGTGQLANGEQQEFFLWPMEMKSTMMQMNKTEIDHETCLNYVNQTLQQFVERQRHCQRQFDERKYTFSNCFTSEMEDTLRQFIEQQEIFFNRLDFERKMAIVKYDYRDRLLEFEYHQLKPNELQINLLENLTRAKQETEKSKYEFELLKQRCHYGYPPEPLQSLQLPLPSLDQITDPTIRQNLFDRSMNMSKQTKSEAMELYLTIAEVQLHESRLKFDQDLLQMRSPDQRLSPSLINIIEKRFQNIDERLQHLYNLKIRFLEQQTTKKKQTFMTFMHERDEHRI